MWGGGGGGGAREQESRGGGGGSFLQRISSGFAFTSISPPPPPPHFPEAFSQREYGAGGKGQAMDETGTKKMLLTPLQPPAPSTHRVWWSV